MNVLLAVPAIVWLLLSAVSFAAGEYLSKIWAVKPSWWFATVVTLVYAVGTYLWLPAMLHKNQLSIMGTLYAIISLVTTLGIGFLVFHESISVTQGIGLALAFVSVILLSV